MNHTTTHLDAASLDELAARTGLASSGAHFAELGLEPGDLYGEPVAVEPVAFVVVERGSDLNVVS